MARASRWSEVCPRAVMPARPASAGQLSLKRRYQLRCHIHLCRPWLAFAGERTIDSQIVLRHPFRAESALECRADPCPIQRTCTFNGRYRIINGVDDEPGEAMIDDLRHGAAMTSVPQAIA